MRTLRTLGVMLLGLGMIVSCYNPVTETQDFATVSADNMDVVERASSGSFDFETIVTVDFVVRAIPPASDAQDYRASEATEEVVVSVVDMDGSTVYEGSAALGAALEFSALAATAEPEYSVVVEQPNVSRKIFRVSEPSRYERVEIVAEMVPNTMTTTAASRDSDGDGIVDSLDAAPQNAAVAFSYTIPAGDVLTVAFEDNFPNVGDADFNDFIAHYKITANTNADNEIVSVVGEITARARAAGYDHRFGIVLDFPGLQANLTGFFYDPDDPSDRTYTYRNQLVSDTANIVIFPSTKQSFNRPTSGVRVDNGYPDGPFSTGYEAIFTMTNFVRTDEQAAWSIGEAPFDPYLYIHNTTYDVHLIGMPELEGTNNPPETFDWDFRDQAGYPRALLVPTDWGHPIETNYIENAYPDFAEWRESEGTDAVDWYLNPDPDQVVYPPSP